MTNLHPVKVTARTLGAENIAVLTLSHAAGEKLPGWAPGDHIDVHLASGLVRQYSLCGALDSEHYRIAVLLDEAGRGGSREIHDALVEGAQLQVAAPRTAFILKPAKKYLFVAGGIGITPLLPMVEKAAASGEAWQLFYAGRRQGAMAFLDEVAAHGPGHIRLFPSEEGQRLDLDAVLAAAKEGAEIYACGPTRLLEALDAKFAAADLSPQLHVEHFAPVAAPGGGFKVELAQSGAVVDVPEGTTILQALMDAGHDVPYSCEVGICGACECNVLEGAPDHRCQVLSDDERAAGKVMMICVSRSLSPVLKLDL